MAIARIPKLFFDPQNAAKVFVVWMMLSSDIVLAFAPCVGGIAYAILYGMCLGFLLKTVANAAANDDALPSLTFFDGIWDDVVIPSLQMAAANITVHVPAAAYLFYLIMQNEESTAIHYVFWVWFLFGLDPVVLFLADDASQFVIAGGLMLLGYFIYPMMLLCVAIEGVPAVARIDLMIRTIISTFPAYALTAVIMLMVLGARLGMGIVSQMAQADRLKDLDLLGILAIRLGSNLLGLILFIFALRVLGYYYAFFKNRFAWSWG